MERLHEVHHLRLRAYRFLSNYGGVGGRGGGGGNGEGEGGCVHAETEEEAVEN